MKTPTEAWNTLKEHNRLVGIGKIARRFFTVNAFDGVLTIMGVLIGSFSADVTSPRVVLTTGFATALAMGVSGLWGAWLTEAAERKKEIEELGQHTLTDLSQTRIGRASRVAVVTVALVNGLSPSLSGAFVLIPFFFAPLMGGIDAAYAIALGLSLAVLFTLGVFLGRLSKQNVLVSGLKMLAAGLVSLGLGLLLQVVM